MRADGALIEHVTKKGKTIRGVIRSDLTQDEAIAIDSGTFQKDGPNGRGYFIRERSLDKLAEHDARKAGGAPAITAAPSVAAPEQPGSATTTPPAPAAPTAPGGSISSAPTRRRRAISRSRTSRSCAARAPRPR